jgi:cellulose synthase/poly-beta-1,6-N-acetylglucosamine synthase-like glycosyltransferase
MPVLINVLLWVIPLLILLPVGILLVECVASILPEWGRQRRSPLSSRHAERPRLAVLIPAHNEVLDIAETLRTLRPQLQASDRLLVIADNCTDDTAAIAQAEGATVLERHDSLNRGKGYALDYGLRALDVDPPDVVVMIDADSNVYPDCLTHVAVTAWKTYRPVQALYLMEQPQRFTPRDSISALAFLFKNLVRPQGLYRLNQPCLLTGTGMAFPWEMIRQSPLASGNIVEDMQLGLDLAIAGHSPLFCRAAKVTGRLPAQDRAAASQRTRWEHGHLHTLFTQVPRLFKAGVSQGRYDLLALALDLLIPPLSLLVLLWGLGLVIAGVGAYLGFTTLPLAVMVLQGLLLFIAIYVGWFAYGQDEVPMETLLAVPLYILWKIPLYFKFLVRRQNQWVRTERDPAQSKPDSPLNQPSLSQTEEADSSFSQ